jgi:hypothetical protein
LKRVLIAALAAAPALSGCAVFGAGAHAMSGMADTVHRIFFSAGDDRAPAAYTRDALAEAAVLYPPALTTVEVPPNHPRLAAAVRAAGYAVTDRDGPAIAGALPVRFAVHSGAAGVDVAVLKMGDQVLTRGYMNGQPATGWSFDAHNAPARTIERLRLVERGVPVDQVSYAYAGAARPDTTPVAGAPAAAERGVQP